MKTASQIVLQVVSSCAMFIYYYNVDYFNIAIEPPDAPRSPSVVAGTCRSLTIQFQLPYLNGSPITTAFVQRRIIEPFSKGPWGSECVYEINNPRVVQVVKHIDYIAEEFDTAMDNNRKADGSYNPFDRKVKKKKELTAKINKYDLVGGPEYVLRVSTFHICDQQ